jgi:hypothetical protein
MNMHKNTKHLIDTVFSTSGSWQLGSGSGPDCPSDGLLAGYMDEALSATEVRQIEDHALICGDCHLVLKSVTDLRGVPVSAPASVSLVARIVQRGLELLNPLEVTLRSLAAPQGELAPALGGMRGAADSDNPEFIAIDGPGHGIDELQIRLQPDGQVRLQIRGDDPPPTYAGEIASVVLEVNGAPREKRPYSGAPLAFAPQDHGHYRIRLVARAPGEDARDLSEAVIELRA